ncbi:MAG: thioredoxin-disulfide reductase [Spirochaetota bacterium]
MDAYKDLIIIGGGAAGLSAAQYAARANLDVLLVEEMASGGQALVIDDLENYPGLLEPVKGYQFAELMEKQAKNFGAEIIISTVRNLEKAGEIFSVETGKGTFTACSVILATGAKHRHLNIPGEKELTGKGVSYCATCDGPFFKEKRMLVVGGGDSACDESMFLSHLTEKLTLVHRRDRFRAQKALAERVEKNKNIKVQFNTIVKEIIGEHRVEKVVLSRTDTNETWEEEMDAVFVFIGSDPQTALVPDAEKDEGGFLVVDECMETTIRGLYAVGDVRSTPFRQVVVAASDGAIAAHCASHYIDELKGNAYT